jgi:hypothetical protein
MVADVRARTLRNLPGPAEYNVSGSTLPRHGGIMRRIFPSEGSTEYVERRAREVPGPGSYTPDLSRPLVLSGGRFSTGARFSGREAIQAGTPGPGEYEPSHGSRKRISGGLIAGRVKSTLDWQIYEQRFMPGPGAHDLSPVTLSKGGGFSSAMRAPPPVQNFGPGPGAYFSAAGRLSTRAGVPARGAQPSGGDMGPGKPRRTFLDDQQDAAARLPVRLPRPACLHAASALNFAPILAGPRDVQRGRLFPLAQGSAGSSAQAPGTQYDPAYSAAPLTAPVGSALLQQPPLGCGRLFAHASAARQLGGIFTAFPSDSRSLRTGGGRCRAY